MNKPDFSERPSLVFYRANPKGTGSAVKLSLHPAHDNIGGSIFLFITHQIKRNEQDNANPILKQFDWNNATVVKLDFLDVSMILQVLIGEHESINNGYGLYHNSTVGSTKIDLRHVVYPYAGYILDICRTLHDTGKTSEYSFIFSPTEACGLTEALRGVMHRIAFGD